MSWTELVKNNLVGTANVSRAAICGLDGTVWGKSDDCNVDPSEALAAARGFSNSAGLLAGGLTLEGQKYLVLRAEDDRIIGKKDARGFFAYKTNQAVIISLYSDGVQPEQCSKVTGALADYFKSIGY